MNNYSAKKINKMYLFFSMVVAIIVIVGLLSGVSIYVTKYRSLQLVSRLESPKDFYNAISVWCIASVWMGMLSLRNVMPRRISELISFSGHSNLSFKQVLFILIFFGGSIWLAVMLTAGFIRKEKAIKELPCVNPTATVHQFEGKAIKELPCVNPTATVHHFKGNIFGDGDLSVK